MAEFIVGALSGAMTMFTALMLFGGRKKRGGVSETANKPSENVNERFPSNDPTVTKRLDDVRKISEEQYDLLLKTQTPSSGALHSKHKNSLIRQIKELEGEKMTILLSILNDGHDPLLTMQDPRTGAVTQTKLSEFVAQMKVHTGEQSAPATEPEMPEVPRGTKITRRGKFFVLESEEDFDRNDDPEGKHTIH